ncbi:hypothetical protein TcarDRAFT_1525 [Thermosinus carboxydivorans Nor1]|uniref:Uncharacterized protein n=1 Tax=Thermosinus carboxydivorans Nor1 TaxID=401526 RepID=A1HPY4_9FIRM|nr:hypothetical protein [Thermosinus carboxydivorans]EAX47836.1 hypothetical protein TcarDRAFT_1525 [Thermosinus carboxydivorans Nor1]
MELANRKLMLQLARTLWSNMYRGKVADASGEYLATIRIIAHMPLDRSDVPADAPVVKPYLTVLIEDGAITPATLVEFESELSDLLLAKFRSEQFFPEFCQFFYPSPAQMLFASCPS